MEPVPDILQQTTLDTNVGKVLDLTRKPGMVRPRDVEALGLPRVPGTVLG